MATWSLPSPLSSFTSEESWASLTPSPKASPRSNHGDLHSPKSNQSSADGTSPALYQGSSANDASSWMGPLQETHSSELYSFDTLSPPSIGTGIFVDPMTLCPAAEATLATSDFPSLKPEISQAGTLSRTKVKNLDLTGLPPVSEKWPISLFASFCEHCDAPTKDNVHHRCKVCNVSRVSRICRFCTNYFSHSAIVKHAKKCYQDMTVKEEMRTVVGGHHREVSKRVSKVAKARGGLRKKMKMRKNKNHGDDSWLEHVTTPSMSPNLYLQNKQRMATMGTDFQEASPAFDIGNAAITSTSGSDSTSTTATESPAALFARQQHALAMAIAAFGCSSAMDINPAETQTTEQKQAAMMFQEKAVEAPHQPGFAGITGQAVNTTPLVTPIPMAFLVAALDVIRKNQNNHPGSQLFRPYARRIDQVAVKKEVRRRKKDRCGGMNVNACTQSFIPEAYLYPGQMKVSEAHGLAGGLQAIGLDRIKQESTQSISTLLPQPSSPALKSIYGQKFAPHRPLPYARNGANKDCEKGCCIKTVRNVKASSSLGMQQGAFHASSMVPGLTANLALAMKDSGLSTSASIDVQTSTLSGSSTRGTNAVSSLTLQHSIKTPSPNTSATSDTRTSQDTFGTVKQEPGVLDGTHHNKIGKDAITIPTVAVLTKENGAEPAYVSHSPSIAVGGEKNKIPKANPGQIVEYVGGMGQGEFATASANIPSSLAHALSCPAMDGGIVPAETSTHFVSTNISTPAPYTSHADAFNFSFTASDNQSQIPTSSSTYTHPLIPDTSLSASSSTASDDNVFEFDPCFEFLVPYM